MAYRGEIEFQTIAPVLSRILAFDCFVYNDDRHLNNYLFRQSRNGWIVLAFDWSRAWMCHGFPPQYPPFHAKQKTLIAHRYLRNRFGNFVDNTSIDSVLDKIAAIDDNTVENIVRGHPEVWLTDSDKDIMLSWWRSNERLDRILAIKKGISDGSYL
jgi:hypothetical protein